FDRALAADADADAVARLVAGGDDVDAGHLALNGLDGVRAVVLGDLRTGDGSDGAREIAPFLRAVAGGDDLLEQDRLAVQLEVEGDGLVGVDDDAWAHEGREAQ